jgi:hypothetical protein
MTFVIKKTICNNHDINIFNASDINKVVFTKKEYLNNNNYEFIKFESQNIKNIVYKLSQNILLGNIAETTSGFGGKSQEITNYMENSTQIKILKGQSILRYTTKEYLYFNFINENITGRTTDINKLGFKQKVLLRKTGDSLIATYDDSGVFPEQSLYFIFRLSENYRYKFILTLLNSKLLSWLYINYLVTNKDSTPQLKKMDLDKIPLPKLENLEQQEPFIQKADLMLELNKKLQTTKQNFYNELGLDKLSNKLQKFEELQFDEFVKEFTKAKKIKFADKLAERNFKNDWKALFENDKKEVLQIQNKINITDKEIDQMVYKLYDLSDDEIKIVEGN